MIYITGDTHGDFSRIERFTKQTSKDDIMIILGDSGINYYGNYRDDGKKEKLSKLEITLFCIHGNHEKRASDIFTYKETMFCGGIVYYEEQYPNLLFAKDGEIYHFDQYDCIVIGGAYSVDKYYRIARNYQWYDNEQPSDFIKAQVENQLAQRNHKIDIVLSHTCPYKYEPVEVFLDSINQNTVDSSTEKWLDTIEEKLNYQKWYCGHFHTSKKIDKLQFMFEDIEVLSNDTKVQ